MPLKPFEIVPFRPTDEPTVCVKINYDWISTLIGMIYPYRYGENWKGTLAENRQARLDVITILDILIGAQECGDMANNCCDDRILPAIIFRVNNETGMMEQSADGGETWQTRKDDPRNAIVMPPIQGGIFSPNISACDKASNFLQHFQDLVDAAAARTGTFLEILVGIAAEMLAAVLLTPEGAAALSPIIYQIAVAVQALGEAGYKGIWSEEDYTAIRCAVYCSIADTNDFTPAAAKRMLQLIQSDVSGGNNLFGARNNTLQLLMGVGYPGWLLWTSFGENNGTDCSDCNCSTCDLDNWQFQDGIHGTNRQTGHDPVFGDFVSGEASLIQGFGYYLIFVTPDKDTCCYLGYADQEVQDFQASTFIIACGNEQIEGNKANLAVTGYQCVDLVQMQSPNPFTGRFFFTQCQPPA